MTLARSCSRVSSKQHSNSNHQLCRGSASMIVPPNNSSSQPWRAVLPAHSSQRNYMKSWRRTPTPKEVRDFLAQWARRARNTRTSSSRSTRTRKGTIPFTQSSPSTLLMSIQTLLTTTSNPTKKDSPRTFQRTKQTMTVSVSQSTSRFSMEKKWAAQLQLPRFKKLLKQRITTVSQSHRLPASLDTSLILLVSSETAFVCMRVFLKLLPLGAVRRRAK